MHMQMCMRVRVYGLVHVCGYRRQHVLWADRHVKTIHV